MLPKFRTTATGLFSNPINVRIVIVLVTLALVALTGGAPNEGGG